MSKYTCTHLEKLSSKQERLNVQVLVVGYGKDDTATTDLKTFFKVKNSWGDAWGEGGYFRLARWEEDKTDPTENWGECAILTLLSYPVME